MTFSQQEKIHQIALSNIQGVGVVLFKQLLEQFGSAQNVFANSQAIDKLPYVRKTIVSSLVGKDTILSAEKLFEMHMKKNVQLVCYGEDSYPKRLSETPHAPPILFCSSKIDFNRPKVLSIVGSRKATSYGKDVVKKLIEELSIYDDLLLISGLAYGIDIHAHRAALEANVPTVGIVAGGVDTIYPFYHTKIAFKMMKQGGVISEQALGISPEKHHFPLRNRIIAGMADACIIVEAGQKSGALITANFANEYNREVFAVPGPIGKTYSKGCNSLIKQHCAHLLTSVEDIAYVMNWRRVSTSKKNIPLRNKHIKLTGHESVVVKTLAELDEFVDIELLSAKTQIESNRLSSIAIGLELKNIVEISAGNKYRLRSG